MSYLHIAGASSAGFLLSHRHKTTRHWTAFDSVDHTAVRPVRLADYWHGSRSYLTDRTQGKGCLPPGKSNSSCPAHIRYSPWLWSWSNVVHQLYCLCLSCIVIALLSCTSLWFHSIYYFFIRAVFSAVFSLTVLSGLSFLLINVFPMFVVHDK